MLDFDYVVLLKGGMALLTFAMYFAVLLLFVTIIKNFVYEGLKALFGKKQPAEAEPGQLPKKTKKPQAAPAFTTAAAADEYEERDAAEMEQEPAIASAVASAATAKSDTARVPEVSFADRLADEFEAKEVSA